MANPLLLPLLNWARKLRYPTLFKLTAFLFALSFLWPFDPIPFIDEIVTALAALVLASWRVPQAPPAPPAGRVIDGESRRE